MASHDLAITNEPVADLRTYHANPRRGNVDMIAKSLRVNGQYRPIVANRGTHTGKPSEVLAGNHTLLAARQEGWETISVCWVDVDSDQASKIVAADNRTADLGDYDEDSLITLLSDLPDLDGTGYTDSDLEKLLNDHGEIEEPPETGGDSEHFEYRIVIDCDNEEQQESLLSKFDQEGLSARPLIS